MQRAELTPPRCPLFPCRHQKFYALTRPGRAYQDLLSEKDEALLPLLRTFQRLARYQRVTLPEDAALQGQARDDYYSGLILKYLGPGPLRW